MGFGWPTEVEFTDATVARLALLADITGQTLERVQRTTVRNELVVELQNEMVASVDTAEGLDVAVAYVPARDELGFGGDWYDVIDLGNGSHVFVVGDVAGHGSLAAARMTATKATIRALARTVSPLEVVPATTAALDHLRSGYVATVGLAWIDQANDRVTWCLAGHPAPILRTETGTVALTGVHFPPIGTPGARRELSSAPCPEGSLLVLYTDGLVERRDTDIDVSIEALRTSIEGLPPGASATEVRDALLADFGDGSDDVAVIVIRRP